MNISMNIVKVLINQQEIANLSCAYIGIENGHKETTITLHQVDKPMAIFSYDKDNVSITHEKKSYYDEFTLSIEMRETACI